MSMVKILILSQISRKANEIKEITNKSVNLHQHLNFANFEKKQSYKLFYNIFILQQDVLGENRDGAHIILFTRGGQDTLSLTDETRIKEFIMYYQVGLRSSSCTIR